MRLTLLCLVLLGTAYPIELRVAQEIHQGSTLRVQVSGVERDDWTAVFLDKTIRLFPDGDDSVLGLMPVPVLQKPGIYPLLVKDWHGTEVRSEVHLLDAHFPQQDILASRRMKGLKPLPGEMEAVHDLQQTVSVKRFWPDRLLRPVPECVNSPFGVERLHNGKPTGNYHRGLDLRSPMGRPVKAAADGIVEIARMFRLHGGTVGIDHGQGVVTTYIHLSKVAVRRGRTVKAGQIVGYVGATGFTTGPHLHWSVYVNGLPVNPADWVQGLKACR
ncbi:MAG: M23 family metallopeptidase [Bryobacteraceae bacterium]